LVPSREANGEDMMAEDRRRCGSAISIILSLALKILLPSNLIAKDFIHPTATKERTRAKGKCNFRNYNIKHAYR
jgi:hypothetical protein